MWMRDADNTVDDISHSDYILSHVMNPMTQKSAVEVFSRSPVQQYLRRLPCNEAPKRQGRKLWSMRSSLDKPTTKVERLQWLRLFYQFDQYLPQREISFQFLSLAKLYHIPAICYSIFPGNDLVPPLILSMMADLVHTIHQQYYTYYILVSVSGLVPVPN